MPSITTTAPAPSANSPETQHTLTLPASIISTLSPTRYLSAHLTRNPPTRPSARTPSTFSPIAITTSTLQNSLGSAVVRSGDTSVVCGIQPEILYHSEIADPPAKRLRTTSRRSAHAVNDAAGERQRRRENSALIGRLGLLVPNIDLGTGCSAAHVPGQPPSAFAQSATQRLYRLLLSSELVDLEDLIISRPRDADADADEDGEGEEEGEETIAYFALHITLLPLSLSSASALLGAAFAAVVAALRDLRLPRAWWDGEREIVVCSDEGGESRGLKLLGAPVVCSWGVFEGAEGGDSQRGERTWYLADPDAVEEETCGEFVSLAVDCSDGGKTRVLRVEKSGRAVVGRQAMRELLAQAEGRWKEVVGAMPSARAGV